MHELQRILERQVRELASGVIGYHSRLGELTDLNGIRLTSGRKKLGGVRGTRAARRNQHKG
jgi:hypothetical protein